MDETTAVPLLVTDDPGLRSTLARLAAASGVTPDIVPDAVAALRSWTAASVVVVGADLAPAVAALGPPHRPAVHVVADRAVPDLLYRAALECGAEDVLVLPEAGTTLVARLSDAGDVPTGPGTVVGVVGGTGGAGATTFAAALAVMLARHRRTLLVDADHLGGGVDRVLGLEDVAGARWDSLVSTAGRLGARSLVETLPRRGRLSVLAWPVDRPEGPPVPVFREVLAAGRRGYPVVVIDLSRQPGPVTAEALARCDVVLLVVTTTLPAMAAAARIAARLPAERAGVVLRSRADPGPVEVERLLGLPVLATMGDQRGLDESVGLGLGPVRRRRGPLARTSADVAGRVLHGRLTA